MKEIFLKITRFKLQSPWIAGQLAIWSFVVFASFCTSLFMHYSSLHLSSTLPTITFAINGCGLLLGGYVAGHKSGRKGWFYGGFQGIIYATILFSISFLAFDSGMRISPALFSAFSFGVGAIGGIIGMNVRK